MASFLFFLLLLSLASAAAVVLAADDNTTAHIHFYMHDTLSGSKPSAVQVIQAPSANGLNFGSVVVVDDPLTGGPNLSSALVGRAQGFYAFASQEANDPALLMTVNLVFVGGAYNGSTLAVLSRDAISEPVRELPVVGGTGKFRMARGYALLKTYSLDGSTGDAVWECDVYAMTETVDWGAAPPPPPLTPPSSETKTSNEGLDLSPNFYFLFFLLFHISICLF
ncbi:dirigent protein 21-like [Canna indica]|uniref:Dirigent protein n=1 Tax=Canna indica TaxID=4628 RepID=A0AAQ3Q9T2_9LILI|nr:dirigent protein 21-like [Canna indica]